MSGIVLSAAVRQNLLSLQSTADLLATTQNRLASGKKVNTALDNPTNFFTAQGLDNRASDINNLLDGIGNGVQVLQAANTGLTSLQKLVDTAKSIANQVLQTTTGYTTKANVTTTAGAVGTAGDLTTGGTTTLQGKTVTLTPATGPALTLTFSNVAGATNVNSLNALNTAIAAAGIGVTASISLTGFLTFTSNNDNASQSITTSGTAAANTVSITGTTASAIVAGSGTPVVDPNSQTTRASLVSQYNNIITQITTTSQDASFNGINLLFGDDLKLTFNETGKSTLTVPGVTYDDRGYRFPGQQFGQRGDRQGDCRIRPVAVGSLGARLEFVDRADPPGLCQEPDQRAADRLGQSDAGRLQRGSGQQPGAVDAPIDRRVRAGPVQPVPAERAATSALSSAVREKIKTAGGKPRRFLCGCAQRSVGNSEQRLPLSGQIRKHPLTIF
jgi:flagellin